MIIIIVSFHNRSSHKSALLQVTSKHWRPPGGCHCICSWAGEILAFLWLFFLLFVHQSTLHQVPGTLNLVPSTLHLVPHDPPSKLFSSRLTCIVHPCTRYHWAQEGRYSPSGEISKVEATEGFCLRYRGEPTKTRFQYFVALIFDHLCRCGGSQLQHEKGLPKIFHCLCSKSTLYYESYQVFFLQWAFICSII